MKLHNLHIDEANLAEFCRRNGIRELRLFGSVTRDDFGPESDVDVIVEFVDEGPSLLGFAGIELQLGNLIGRPVHLHTANMIHPYLRRQIMQGAKVAYAA